ncbi:hypothetical protein NON00_02260 [Roseomonas sp. GC11]|uniref:hypothetical protein n=1 Tax=Roseomonas sp. GC11 TaxID=2950546 RepID=UPI00210B5A4E|nr:hypothetical protein [Roseomonas sp. GC11]MCQ4158750.1 hypothetical protein [Roseomonas sp. GC11]
MLRFRSYMPGRVYFPMSVAVYAPAAITFDRLYVTPFDVSEDTLVPDQIGIRVTTAMTVGTGGLPQVILGIYEDEHGLPGRLLYTSNVIAGLNTVGAKVQDIATPASGNRPLQMTNGLYWLASLFATAGTGGTLPSVASVATNPAWATQLGVADMASLPISAATTATGLWANSQPFASGLPTRPARSIWAQQLNAGSPLIGLRHGGP